MKKYVIMNSFFGLDDHSLLRRVKIEVKLVNYITLYLSNVILYFGGSSNVWVNVFFSFLSFFLSFLLGGWSTIVGLV